jgi:hypothetical protein
MSNYDERPKNSGAKETSEENKISANHAHNILS